MQKLARDYLDELNRRHKKNRKALVAWILLATLVVGTVMGTLSQYGVALSNDSGKEAHGHSSECYDAEGQLICDYEEHADTDSGQRSNGSFDEPAADDLDSAPVQTPSGGSNEEKPDPGTGEEILDGSDTEDKNSGTVEETPDGSDTEDKNSGTVEETPDGTDTEDKNPGTGEETPDGTDTEDENSGTGEETPDGTDTEDKNPVNPDEGTQDPVLPDDGTQTPALPDDANPDSTLVDANLGQYEMDYMTHSTPKAAQIFLEESSEENANYAAWPAEGQNENAFNWDFNAQYVVGRNSDNTDDSLHHTVKTDNFNLKYQLTFNTDENLDAGAVEIRIPRGLLELHKTDGSPDGYRYPDDIAVERVENKNDTTGIEQLEGKTSFPFCYYIERGDGGNDTLVFFNYKEIAATSNLAWQVLYKNVRIMNLMDGDHRELEPQITVTKKGTDGQPLPPETRECTPLTIEIDSKVTLENVSKTSYKEPGKNFTPGLYTKAQVKSYLENENMLDAFLERVGGAGEYGMPGANFNDYKYVVWDITASGKATQPWKLEIEEAPGEIQGEKGQVVGYKWDANTIQWTSSYDSEKNTTTLAMTDWSSNQNWSCRLWVVTAYPARDIYDGTPLDNNITVRAVPLYGVEKDEEEALSQEKYAAWSYADYEWIYDSGGLFAEKKNTADETKTGGQYRQTYSGWLDAYNYNADAQRGKDYGGLPYYVSSSFSGYNLTHVVHGTERDENGNLISWGSGMPGSYIAGTKYGLVTTDGLLYAYAEDSGNPDVDPGRQLMTWKDYYYTGVTITQTDTGYNIWEDRKTMPKDVPEYEEIPEELRGTAVKIYAMFANPQEDGEYAPSETWEEIAISDTGIKMDDATGTVTYTFDKDILARQPWRVKVVHETVHYSTDCQINLELCIRHDSPVMWGDDGEKTGENDQNDNKYGLMERDGGFTSGGSYSIGLWGLAEAYGTVTNQEYGMKVWEDWGAYEDNKTYMYRLGENLNADMYIEQPDVTEELADLYKSEFKSNNNINGIDFGLWMVDGLEGEPSEAEKEELENALKEELGNYLYFAAAYKTLSSYEKEAGASKESKTYVDPASAERMLVEYRLTAYDGYQVSRKQDQEFLPAAGVPSPGRNRVEFYDLLPLGMTLDPSYTPKAGRITNIDGRKEYQKRPELWEYSEQTKVSYEILSTDHNQTGRTLVRFTVEYSGGDPSVYTDNKWVEAWGVDFRAYYNKKDMALVSRRDNDNISAFMSGDPERMELYGKDSQVAKYDGKLANGSQAYGGKLGENFSGKTPEQIEAIDGMKVVLYADATVYDDVAVNSQISLEKKVRVSGNGSYGAYADYAVVQPGGEYEYNITVNGDGAHELKDIVVFDFLEQADSAEGVTHTNTWQGAFNGVNTIGLGLLGINPVVYYGTEGAEMPPTDSIQSILNDLDSIEGVQEGHDGTNSKHWCKSEDYKGKLKDVKAIAVYFQASNKADSYIFSTQSGSLTSASFRIRMKAPSKQEFETAGIDTGSQDVKALAYNQPYYYALQDGAAVKSPNGNITAVKASDLGVLCIAKEFDAGEEEPHDSVRDTVFKFQVKKSDGKTAFGGQTYTLYEKGEDGAYKPVGSGATSLSGELSLKAGQMADFGLVSDAKGIRVTEVKDIFWEADEDQITPGEPREVTTADGEKEIYAVWNHTIANKFRPPVYFRKKLEGVPAGISQEERTAVNDSWFTFKVSVWEENQEDQENGGSWIPLKDSEFWYVKGARLDGGLPEKDTGRVPSGIGQTDGQGQFMLKAGETIVLFPGNAGTKYKIEEISSQVGENGTAELMSDREFEEEGKANSRWICKNPVVVEESLAPKGASDVITNYYRWKELYLTKNITHQEKEDYDGAEFTFKITKVGSGENEKAGFFANLFTTSKALPITWTLLDENGEPAKDKDGKIIGDTIGADGKFTCACGWRTVRISGLEAGEIYTVEELDPAPSALYEKKTDPITVEMPTAASNKKITFINDYLKRSLSVTKTVVISPTADDEAKLDAETTPFAMTIRTGADKENLLPLADCRYTIINSDGSMARSYKTDRDGEPIPCDTTSKPGVPTFTTGKDGKIWLCHGQTAVLCYAGKKGEYYEVSETQNEEYTQIYPESKTDADGNDVSAPPHTGSFDDDDVELSFVNGVNDGTTLYISKEYVPASIEFNSRQLEELYIESVKNSSLENGRDGFVKLKLTITDKYGMTKDYMGPVFLISKEGDRENERRSVDDEIGIKDDWGSDDLDDPSVYELDPNYTAMITGLDSDSTYTLTEVEESRHRIVMQTIKSWSSMPHIQYFEISQKTPADDGSLTGTTKKNPRAVITNQVKFIYSNKAKIMKGMAAGSSEVPTGAKLVWELQQYDGTRWSPAGNVEYVTFDGAGVTCSQVKTTGSDGRIVLYKTEDGFPGVGFPGLIQNMVQVNVYDDKVPLVMDPNSSTGEAYPYRIIEIPEESDSEWGLLAGYTRAAMAAPGGTNPRRSARSVAPYVVETLVQTASRSGGTNPSQTGYGLYLNPLGYVSKTSPANPSMPLYGLYMKGGLIDTFVNSNVTTPVIIEKKMEIAPEDPTAVFTMTLKQVVSCGLKDEGDRNKLPEPDPATYVTEPRKGIPYEIYENGSHVGDGFTGENGEILLKANQYAQIELPINTLWTVSEGMGPVYELKDLRAENTAQPALPEDPENPETPAGPAVSLTKRGDNLMEIDLSREDEERKYAVVLDWGNGSTEVRYVSAGEEVVLPDGSDSESEYDEEFGVVGWAYSPGDYTNRPNEIIRNLELISSDIRLYAVREFHLVYGVVDEDTEELKYEEKVVTSTDTEVNFTLPEPQKEYYRGWRKINPTTGNPSGGNAGNNVSIGRYDTMYKSGEKAVIGAKLVPWLDYKVVIRIKNNNELTNWWAEYAGKWSSKFTFGGVYGSVGITGAEINAKLDERTIKNNLRNQNCSYIESEPEYLTFSKDNQTITLIYEQKINND